MRDLVIVLLLLTVPCNPSDLTPSGAEPQVAPASAVEDDLVQRGLTFLLDAQQPDGSWRIELGESKEAGMRIAITAICMDALSRHPDNERCGEALRRGLEFIRKNVKALDSPFDVNPTFNFNLWGMAFGLSHLFEAVQRWPGQKPDVDETVRAMVKRAARFQLECGGWSYIKVDYDDDNAKSGSVSFLTAATLEGLLRWKSAGVSIDAGMIDRGVADLKQSFGQDDRLAYKHYGRYGAPGGGDSAGRSIQGRLVLHEAGVGSAEDVLAAVKTFFAERHEYVKTRTNRGHTPPTMIAGYYYYYVHHYAARALRLLTSDPGDCAKTLRQAFAEEQREDGSWMDTVSGGSTCGTAFVLIALDDLDSMAWMTSLDDALGKARESASPLLVLISDGKKTGKSLEDAFADASIVAMLGDFTCVKLVKDAKDPVRKRVGAGRTAAFLVVDPSAEDPFKKPLKRVKGKRKAPSISRTLKSALKTWEKRKAESEDS